MRFDILTLFPEVCRAYCEESILGRAQRAGKLEIMVHNIRDYTKDKHGRVDDYPYGGGNGMVMQPQPVLEMCIRDRSYHRTMGEILTAVARVLSWRRSASRFRRTGRPVIPGT